MNEMKFYLNVVTNLDKHEWDVKNGIFYNTRRLIGSRIIESNNTKPIM
jgi:hypothetical protein